MDEKRIILRLTKGDTNALQKVYHQFRQPFRLWAKARFSGVEVETIDDVFSDVVLDFYENVRKGKYAQTASLKTYLFTLGRYKLINITKKRSMQQSKEADIVADVEHRTTINPFDEQQKNEQFEVIQTAMKNLCDDCRGILTHFYYHNMSMSEIAEKMDYKNSNVAKSKKNVCYKKLKKLVQEVYSKTDFF